MNEYAEVRHLQYLEAQRTVNPEPRLRGDRVERIVG